MTTLFLRIYVFLCSGFIVLSAYSQHELESRLNLFRPGDEIQKQQVSYKDPGRSGENVLWDFSNLHAENKNYRLVYSGRPDSIITGTEHRTMYYYSLSGDSLLLTGYENPTTLMQYQQPELLLRFPVHYGDSTYGHFQGTGQYSNRLQIQVMGTVRSIADAYGTLILPDKDTLRQVLRVKTIKWMAEDTRTFSSRKIQDSLLVSNDSIDFRLANDPVIIGIETCRWYARGYRYPVFETVKSIFNRKDSEADNFHTAFFYPPQFHSYLEEDEENRALLENDSVGAGSSEPSHPDNPWQDLTYNAYPNPVQTNLNLEIYLPIPAQTVRVQLTDRQGRILKEDHWGAQPAGILSKQIFMAPYIRGEYILHIRLDESFMFSEIILKR